MQAEIEAAAPPRGVQILGVNLQGLEAGNPAMVAGRTLPWLQDRADVDAWTLWNVRWRDIVIVDQASVVFAVYNATDNDLAIPANYAALRAMILDAASR